jgi:hypothetical protein
MIAKVRRRAISSVRVLIDPLWLLPEIKCYWKQVGVLRQH